MAPLFGPSPRDRRHLVETLENLGPTSIAGLSAALSWSPRRTEKVVREVVRRAEAEIVYDPSSRILRFPEPVPSPSAAPERIPADPQPSAPTPPPSVSGGYSSAPTSRMLKRLGHTFQCPTCHVALETTGTGESMYCPKCGRLTSAPRIRALSFSPAADAASSDAGLVPPSAPTTGSPGPRADRRAQELFAAWITSSPIPCPKCRTPLKHRSFAQYVCPKCGQSVTFSTPDHLPVTTRSGGTEELKRDPASDSAN